MQDVSSGQNSSVILYVKLFSYVKSYITNNLKHDRFYRLCRGILTLVLSQYIAHIIWLSEAYTDLWHIVYDVEYTTISLMEIIWTRYVWNLFIPANDTVYFIGQEWSARLILGITLLPPN